jgi:hypothetical protein
VISCYFLDVDDIQPIVEVARQAPTVSVHHHGPYVVLTSEAPLTVDRRATGVRHAIWYSSIAALQGGTVVQHDKDALRLEPT